MRGNFAKPESLFFRMLSLSTIVYFTYQFFQDERAVKDLKDMTSKGVSDLLDYSKEWELGKLKLTGGDSDFKKKYKKTNPFKFMETIGLPGKTNFFEMRPTEYQDAHVGNANSHDYFVLDDKF